MKLIDSSVEYIPQQEDLAGVYKMIELAGRVSYKSEDKIDLASASSFVERLINSNHLSPLEFGTLYLVIPYYSSYYETELVSRYRYNPYSRVTGPSLENGEKWHISTNYRVYHELAKEWKRSNEYISPRLDSHIPRITLKFICSRGIAQEITRHRTFSFCMESQRYCNYSKGKFNSELTFIRPVWTYNVGENSYHYLLDCLKRVENDYMAFISNGLLPQAARDILPNATKTELIVCGFIDDWKHFFDLRYFGTTGKPHPDMLELTTKAKKVLEDNNLWDLIIKA